MAAYPFQTRFVFPILLGVKPHTIRRRRVRRLTVAGDRIQMFTHWRTPQVCQFGVAPCIKVEPVIIYPWREELLVADEEGVFSWVNSHRLFELARYDGFSSIHDFFEFFKRYGQKVLDDFEIIHWDPMRVEVAPGVRMFSAASMWAVRGTATPYKPLARDAFLREYLNPWTNTEEVKHG